MKILLIFPLLLIFSLPAVAQNWVTIPDANFANKLNELFPECMNGNQIDGTCPAVSETTFLDVSFSNISDLSGVHVFANLVELDCSYNSLSNLPNFNGYNYPHYIDCSNNNLTELSNLPSALWGLNCMENNLSSIQLPDYLVDLDCRGNWLVELPELPPYLTHLKCSVNSLQSLPELPSTLTELWCAYNNISELPDLPSSLELLLCDDNNLSFLPELPSSLESLQCRDNVLTSLPALPQSLWLLDCYNNNLNCLPQLPESISDLFVSNNPFTCLPNYLPVMEVELLSFPLCNTNDFDLNPFGCSGIEGISGTVFSDENANCVADVTESGVKNIPMKLWDQGGNLISSMYTLDNQSFTFMADTGEYIVQMETENQPYQSSCTEPGNSQDVWLTDSEPAAHNVDFGIECLPGYDIGVQSVVTTGWVFPGQTHTLKIEGGDMSSWYGLNCAEVVEGTVTIYVYGSVSYLEPAENALIPTVTGDLQFTYNIADFTDVNFQQDFALLLLTDTTAQAEELVCVDIIVEPIDGDYNPSNNIYTHCYPVVNSYDPNIKQVWPHNVEPGFDGYFNYTIYFQNTGTAPAFNIRVADTLDTNLDLNTFEVTGYSHECLTYVSGNVATFRFNNIMLPDSTSDFDGSIGYVQYRIKPTTDLPVGTVIENTAHIYFDFNDAIVTNTTENEYVITTSVADHIKQQVQVFPNPGTGIYNVSLHSKSIGVSMIEIYTLSGVRVLEQSVNSHQTTLDLTNQPPGLYLLRVQNELGSEVVKIVKQ